MWAVSDDALLAGLATGDPDAAAAFVRRFQRRVFGLALTIVGDARAAEAISLEAFARAREHADSYDARRGSVVTWLLTSTRVLAIDAVRPERLSRSDADALLTDIWAGSRLAPDDMSLEHQDAARLKLATGQLPPDQRRALGLSAFLGFSAAEIAESEGISIPAARARLRAAIQQLRVAMVHQRPGE
ncbi:MAG: subfamily polymerase sigma-24 subunit [Actinomycetia bacterium]|nr:subfamily polymerase sigma-24 subunit [Actinomycetes bacterium]